MKGDLVGLSRLDKMPYLSHSLVAAFNDAAKVYLRHGATHCSSCGLLAMRYLHLGPW